MIYQIKSDANLLYDLREKELYLEEPVLNLEINKIGSLNFVIHSDHPYFDRLDKLTSKIEAYRDGKTIFRGRIISDIQTLYNSKKIECESSLGFLNDSVIRPQTFQGTPEELFNLAISNHNSQVSEHQQLKIGRITVTDPNDYIYRRWEGYLSTLELINTRCLESLGGYLVERYENDGTYIDWLADFDTISGQNIECGENLMDIYAINDASLTYSVVIPLGYEIEQEDGTYKRLTIEEVNGGKDYLVNNIALEKYGWIVAPTEETTWDDVTLPDNLKEKGQELLNKNAVTIKSSIELTALDLSATDVNIEAFFIYEYVNVISKPHNLNSKFLLKQISIPFLHPEDIVITLGETKNTLTGINLGNQQEIDNVIKRVGNIEADYVKNTDISKVVEEEIRDSSIIKQLPEEIMTEVEKEYISIEKFEEMDLQNQISENATNINNDYQDLVSQLSNKASTESVTSISNKVQEIQTSTSETIKVIEEIQNNGVTQVKTENNFIFDKDGLTMDETGAPVKNRQNAYGMEIIDKTSSAEVTQLFTGLVNEELVQKNPELANFLNQILTYTNNIFVGNFLKMANGRWENTTNATYGKGIGFFPGGDN